MRDVTTQMYDRLLALVERVNYRKDYYFLVGITDGMKYPYLQIAHLRPDSITGEIDWGRGGKAYISQHATDSEIFQTMLGLAKAYEEHEAREFFLVDGKRVFGPHITTTALAKVCDETDYRA
jgi:hypothetical protein